MEMIFIPTIILTMIGLSIFIVKSDKAAIRKQIAMKGFELIHIRTSYNFFWRTFKYSVIFKNTEGIEIRDKCRVSFVLGVIWEDEDSFVKWLVP